MTAPTARTTRDLPEMSVRDAHEIVRLLGGLDCRFPDSSMSYLVIPGGGGWYQDWMANYHGSAFDAATFHADTNGACS